MSKFYYEARDAEGAKVNGELDSTDALDAVQQLQSAQGLRVIAVRTEAEELEREARIQREIAEREHRDTEEARARAQAESDLAANLPAAAAVADAQPKRRWWSRFFAADSTVETAAPVVEPAAGVEAPPEAIVSSRHLLSPEELLKARRRHERRARREAARREAEELARAERAAAQAEEATRTTEERLRDEVAPPPSDALELVVPAEPLPEPAVAPELEQGPEPTVSAPVAQEQQEPTGPAEPARPLDAFFDRTTPVQELQLAPAPAPTPAAVAAPVVTPTPAPVTPPPAEGRKPSFWQRLLALVSPKRAAELAASDATRAAAETAAAAARAATESAQVVQNLNATAGDVITKARQTIEDAQHFSRVFGALIVQNHRRGITPDAGSLRLRKKGRRKGEVREGPGLATSAEEDASPAGVGSSGDIVFTPKAGSTLASEKPLEGLSKLLGRRRKKPADAAGKLKATEDPKSKDSVTEMKVDELGSFDLTSSITKGEGAKDAAVRDRESLTDEERAAGDQLLFDLKRIEIEATGLRGWIRLQVARFRVYREQQRRARLAKAAAKAKAAEEKRRNEAELKRQKEQVKQAKAAKKAKKAQELAEQQTRTMVVEGVDGKKLPWYQFLLDIFKPKKAGDASEKRRLSFNMTEEEQQREAEKARLQIQGFKPTGNPFVDTYNKLNEFLITHQSVGVKDLVTFYTLLAVMINSGIPLVKSLHQLVEQQKNARFKRILFQIVYEVENGKSLSRAMRQFPDVFNDAHLGMVEAGEASGQLGQVMKRIAEEAEKSSKMLSKVKGALIYPMVIFCILIVVMVVVMVAVVPKIQEVFAGAGVELPLPTRILIAMSEFLINRWYVLVVIIGSIVFGVTTYLKTEEGKYYFDYFKLKVPIFGALFTKVALARFTSSLANLSSSGLSIIKALKINADSVGNEIYRQEILATAESVKKGVSIAKDLQGNKLFPAMVVDMIAVGEETAQVANVSQKIAEFYEAEVDDMVKNMQSLMEPIIIVVMGVAVGGLVAAIMLPIMNLSEVATSG